MGETQGTMKAVFASVLSLLIIGVLFVALSPDDVSQSTSVAGVAATELQDLVEFLPKGKDAGGHISGMGKCSSSQVSKLKRGIDQAAPFIKKAIDNRDTAAWTKWFGAATSQQTNADVQTRLNDGYKQVTSSDWEPRCCACQGSTDQECANNCKGNTMAFVQSYKYQGSDKEYQYNQIQFCASVFSTTDVQLGLIAFHESVHMVSAAGDGYGAYGKKSLIKLAASEPDKARLTANSYMLYAAQAGMNHAQYDSATSLWGGSMNADGTCQDKYSNCADMAKQANMCARGTVSSGATVGVACCHSCKVDVSTQMVAETQLQDQVEFLPKGKDAGGHISGMGKCSSSQVSKLKRGIADAAPFIKKAIDNRDTAAWTKWFGAATSQQTNADVQTRLNDGYKQVTSSDWEPRCCASQGSTDQECANNCKGNTMAFVQSYTYQGSDKEYQYEQIQFCASAFSATDVQLGLIAFHESVHMVSAAGDGYGAYGKESLIKLAASEPDKARLTANSYMLYAAQAGMPHSEYDSATSLWGGSMNADGTCQDKYSNCAELGSSASSCST